jgi:tetratricopeptide (TPR) repeat protein
MALFGNFDFGKGLKKQAEAFSRAPSSVRARKQPVMIKQLDEYASRFLATVIAQSAQVNPGQLRSGAEALLEVAATLHESASAYRCFAELAARSRKVPAVPQLGQLVDRLLEQPTDQSKDRATLLTYRIVTGTLGSERFIEYLKERAHLTAQTTDWKEYALGIARLIRDGVVQGNDELVSETLQDLVNNKAQLGDQVVPIQQMLAESMMQRRNHRQAEFILVEAAISGAELPDSFFETVDALLAARPETCWELHQLVITRALARFENGELDWPSVLQKLAAAKLHETQLITFLLEHPLTPKDPHLDVYIRQNLQHVPEESRAQLTQRYEQLTGGRVLQPTAQGASAASASVPPPPKLARASGEGEPLDYLQNAALGLADVGSLRNLLRENVKVETLDMMSARALLRQLTNAGLPEWAPLEARLWMVEQLSGQSKERLAVQLLDDLLQQATPRETQQLRDRLGNDQTQGLAARLRKSLGARSNAEVWLRLVRITLNIGEFRSAKELVVEIDPETEQRKQAFAELEHWITRQAQPTPWMLITLSEARRDASDDAKAGFDVATQAALLAPHDANVQKAYSAWTGQLPAEVVHERRLSQGMYLLTRDERTELLPVVLGELESAHSNGLDISAWFEQLVPVIDKLRGASRSKSREALLRLVATAHPAAFEVNFEQLTAELEDEDKYTLLKSISESDPVTREHLSTIMQRLSADAEERARARVETEIETARSSARPVRYSAGEIQPGEPASAPAAASPWRRSLAVARRKRVAGDIQGAIRDLQAALELEPQEAELSIELAESFADRQDYAISRKILGDTLETLGDEGNVELRLRSLYCLATVIEHLDNPAEAMHCLEELLIIRHDYRDSQERLETLQSKMQAGEAAPVAPSNIAANVILEGILDLLNARAEEAEVSD